MKSYTWEDFRNAGLLTLVLALLIAITNIAAAISMHGINHLQIDPEMLAIVVVVVAIGSCPIAIDECRVKAPTLENKRPDHQASCLRI
jgi:hypothetical protein